MSTFLSILPIIIALVLYFTGLPIAYALFAAALTYFGFIDTTTVPCLLMQKFITSTQSFPFRPAYKRMHRLQSDKNANDATPLL